MGKSQAESSSVLPKVILSWRKDVSIKLKKRKELWPLDSLYQVHPTVLGQDPPSLLAALTSARGLPEGAVGRFEWGTGEQVHSIEDLRELRQLLVSVSPRMVDKGP